MTAWKYQLLMGLGCLTLVGCGRSAPPSPRASAKAVSDLRALFKSDAPSSSTASTSSGPAEATGWATLSGTFTVDGDAPAPKKLAVDKDQETCGKESLVDESVIVNSGGLQGGVIFLRSENIPVHESRTAPPDAEVTLDNRNCRFEPHVQLVRTGQTLLLKNSDPVLHNSKIECQANAALNPSLPGNSSQTFKLAKAEKQPVRVSCSVHPWMQGVLVVRSDPYAAVTDAQGKFQIEKVPAGIDLEFQLWHEKAKGSFKGVSVSGEKVDDKGRLKIRLEPDQNKQLQISIPVALLK